MALNTPYKRINPNSINYAAVGQRDPWFALGYALGEGYWNNYNARGEEKATQTAESMLEDYLKTGSSNKKSAPQGLVDQAMSLSVGGETISEDSANKASSGKEKGTIKPEVDHALLKWDYLSDKYKNSPNPVGDSIAAQNLVNSTELALGNTNMGAFDEAQFKLALDKKLMADGRNTQQREAAWAAVQPLIAQKKSEYNTKVSNQLYGLYKQAQELGDYSSADGFLIEIQKINPNMGKIIMDGRVTERDRFKAAEARELAAIRANARNGKGKNQSSNTINATSKSELDHAYKVLENPDMFGPDAVKSANAIIAKRDKWGMDGLDLDDEVQVSNYLKGIKNRVNSGELDLLQAYDEMYNDGFIQQHPYAEDLLKNTGLYYHQQWDEKNNAYSTYNAEDYKGGYEVPTNPDAKQVTKPRGKTLLEILDEVSKDNSKDERGRTGWAKRLG